MNRAADSGHRIVVFGGAGFLGSFVADALSHAGNEVIIFDRIASSYLRPDQIGIVGDILDLQAVSKAMQGCDVVYNYAGIADIEIASREPLEAVRTNVLGNTVLLEAARDRGIERYVFASTLYVYSNAGGFYRSTKQACELIIEDYQKTFGLSYTVLRYGSLYGPRAGPTNWVYSMLREAVLRGIVRRTGEGDEIREYIHVWDAASSSVDVLAPEFRNTQVIISGQQQIRVKDLLDMVRAMLGGRLQIEWIRAAGASAPTSPSLHYHVSPYSFSPRVARKITRASYVDLGQGLLNLMDDIYAEQQLHDPNNLIDLGSTKQ